MEFLHKACAGLDVHKKTVMACVRRLEGQKLVKEIREFGTTTAEILGMAAWLHEHQVTHVAMESTGVFWKPIYNLLDGDFEVMLCNARHIKHVPGRKTDVKDAEWIAQLLQLGLLKPSFVPRRPQRDLRDLTRQRAQLMGEQGRVVNRIHKILEDANIKLGSVATDIVGKSGRAMLEQIVLGETDPAALAELARGRLRNKIPELRLALHGGVTDHHRFMIRHLCAHLDFVGQQVEALTQRIDTVLAADVAATPPQATDVLPFREAVELVDGVPGFDRNTAENVLAETGTNMRQFPSAKNLASWTGQCPGNNESAGKRRNQPTPRGNRWLRRALNQAAWAASRTKGTYFSAQYRRICSRRGKKRAIVAVGHSLLHVIYHILDKRIPYRELGADFFNKLDPERTCRYLTRRLEDLGFNVILQRKPA